MAGRPRGRVPTIEELQDLYNKGDYEALNKLNKSLANRANTRLMELEGAGMDTTAAYTRATYWINENSDSKSTKANRFSRSSKLDIDDLYNQLVQVSDFLRWQTSTVAGEQKRREEVFKKLTTSEDKKTRPFIEIPEGVNLDSFKKKFLKFLDDNVWTEIKKYFGSDALQSAGEAIANGATVGSLTKAFKDYEQGKTDDDIFTIWTNWTSIKK